MNKLWIIQVLILITVLNILLFTKILECSDSTVIVLTLLSCNLFLSWVKGIPEVNL